MRGAARAVLFFGVLGAAWSWAPPSPLRMALKPPLPRRELVLRGAGVVTMLGLARPAAALVRGNAPPSERKAPPGAGRGQATSMDDAYERGWVRQDAMEDLAEDYFVGPLQRTPEGDRYRDVVRGDGGRAVQKGDRVDVRYRVMKLGKRSRDGLSGGAQGVFSLGYGEDDDKEGDFVTTSVGNGQLVEALDSGIRGMTKGGKRRVFIAPQRGWKDMSRPECSYDGAGGGNRVDWGVAVGIPNVSVAEAEDCLNLKKLPRPGNFGAKRRLARRFDEGLIVEVEVVDVK